MIRAVVLLIAAAAIALPAWAVATYKMPPPLPFVAGDPGPGFRPGKVAGEPSDAQVARWQKLADNSCKCARRGGESGACWAEYDRQTAAYTKGDWGTLCMPISRGGDCFGGDIVPGKCIEIDRDHAGHLLCTAEERGAMEAAWNREMASARGESDAAIQQAMDRAGAAMDRVYARILRNESLADIKGPPGCGG